MEVSIWYTPIQKRSSVISKCPSCNKYNFSSYQGVFCLEEPYYKIFQCENSTCKKYYTVEIIKGEKGRAEALNTKRDIDYFLSKRTACPLCIKFKKNMNCKDSLRKLINTEFDFEYKYVIYMGKLHHSEQNKFYCNNHTKSLFRQKYQFVKNINERITMGLGRYIKESSSQYFYNQVREIYKEENEKKYPFKEDPENILSKLYALGIPQPSLARIFHTSQPTISRLIKKNMFNEPKHTLYIEKNHTSLFYTQVKTSKKALIEVKRSWKNLH